MEINTNLKKTKHTILILYGIIGGILIFGISKISLRKSLYDFYTSYEKTHSIEYFSGKNNLPPQIKEHIKEIQSYQLTKNHKYAEALKILTGQNSKNYYNVGTIKTLRAYHQALSNSLSGLQKARHIIIDAYQDLQRAEKIQLDNALNTYIQNNKQIAQKLGIIIQIKTCYQEHLSIIDALETFKEKLKQTTQILKEEEKKIRNTTQIDKKCQDALKNINITSQIQISQLQDQIHNYQKTYKTNLGDALKKPQQCLDMTMTDIQATLDDAQASIDEFNNNHFNTIQALKDANHQMLKDLCNFAKNDAQINEKIDNAISKLLQQLENNLTKKYQENTKQKFKEQEETPSDQNKTGASQTEIQYKNIFEEKELQLLQEIENNNKMLIKQIQEIKGSGRYNPKYFLYKLFQEFYGKESTFENLLKNQENKNSSPF